VHYGQLENSQLRVGLALNTAVLRKVVQQNRTRVWRKSGMGKGVHCL